MTPKEWQQVKDLFHAALQHEASERASFLDEACSGDSELRRELESLLDSYEKSGEFIDAPAYQAARTRHGRRWEIRSFMSMQSRRGTFG